MKRNFLLVGIAVSFLAGCGSSKPPQRHAAIHAPAQVAQGPLSSACLASNRTARSRNLCGCIQAVANHTLTGSQQQRAVTFYSNPHQAQVIRQSDRAADEQFWKAYRNYAERAEQICQ